MAVLSDYDIVSTHEETLDLVLPWDAANVQPSSYELHLGEGYKFIHEETFTRMQIPPIDVTDKAAVAALYFEESPDDGKYFLYPGDFALVTTEETVHIPADLLARVEGKSSLARVGLMVHITAGFIDPGFHGQITLEVVNLSPRTLALPIGMKIAQLAFEELSTPALRPYGSEGLGSRYQNQSGVGISQAVSALNTYHNRQQPVNDCV